MACAPRTLSVLVVSHNEHMQRLLRDLLRAKGRIEVESASSHAEGQEWLRVLKFDFVLLHVADDEGGALEFIRAARDAASPTRYVPVFVITSNALARVAFNRLT